MNNITSSLLEVVTTIVVALVPVLTTWITKKIASNVKAVKLVQALGPLATAAVYAAEHLATTKELSGIERKELAVSKVMDALSNLGFTKADSTMIMDAVEKAYANSKETLANVYTTVGATTVTTTTTQTPTVETLKQENTQEEAK